MEVVVGGVKNRRFLFGALVSVAVIWFIFLAISVNRQNKRTMIVPSSVISKHLKLKSVGVERRGLGLHTNTGMIYVSKRRVPNGPDPIHNRYTHSCSQLTGAFEQCYFYIYSIFARIT